LARQWQQSASSENQSELIQKFCTEMGEISLELEEAQHNLTQTENKRTTFKNEEELFYSKYSSSPEDVLYKANVYNEKLIQVKSQTEQLDKTCYKQRLQLEELLTTRLSALKAQGLTQGITHESVGSAELMILDIQTAYEHGISQTEGLEIGDLRKQYADINKHISTIETEIQQIEESLKKVEEVVISQAKIIATTLTRAYLRDSIQARRFDTVILDEASMAPIPALWAVAGLADLNAVVVGDPEQLPPIVISPHPLAKEWLGLDIFNKAKIEKYDKRPYVVALKKQYRMHPDISKISNELIYKTLDDGEIKLDDGNYYPLSHTKCDENLMKWYRSDWGHDQPVLLVNTASVGAWVTSVSRGMRASRLNFLSATICVDIAEQLLRYDREPCNEMNDPHILMVCPYSPHAKLLKILLEHQNLKNDVRAGTVYNFQGAESDVVILDLVNDEPHWRVGMFDFKRDNNTKRLLNVALTRARRRLIIVGDFEYILKLSKKAFIGAELIPFLQEHYVCVDALNIVPAGLSARVAKAQTSVIGGEIEPNSSRVVISQEHFYPMLRGDLSRAKGRVVIYSAFITSERIGYLEPSIRAAIEQGIRVYVITKAREDRNKRELSTYRMLEQALINWGVVVIHKRGMHEKLVFIDDDIIWMGSLNPLSFSNTQEIMERRKSPEVVKDFVKTLRLNDLIDEYKEGIPICPICKSEMVASEGGNDPFYWRCVEDECYSRSIDQPPLKGDTITCANCGENVEYGEWGGEPHWRCIKDRKHRQKIARTHLRLPKMRALIPKHDLSKLDKLFNITTSTTQSNLFK
ncbi:MAG: AAA domain-containing protein, partial [bacterium]|nr:AAA domain-containing protein [bacterium]